MTADAPRATGRKRSQVLKWTMRFAVPVSSSMRHERDPLRSRGPLPQQDEARDAVAAFGLRLKSSS